LANFRCGLSPLPASGLLSNFLFASRLSSNPVISIDMTPTHFRHLALAIPSAVEKSHMAHPDFRLGGKIFASLGKPDEEWGMVKLTPEQQETLVSQAPAMFQPPSGAWGRQGYTRVHLPSVKVTLLRRALQMAAKNVVDQQGKRKKG
jgi:hypothetical protein